jgi:hypothetical protein
MSFFRQNIFTTFKFRFDFIVHFEGYIVLYRNSKNNQTFKTQYVNN